MSRSSEGGKVGEGSGGSLTCTVAVPGLERRKSGVGGCCGMSSCLDCLTPPMAFICGSAGADE